MTEKQIYATLSANAFWMVNKAIARQIGFDTAALLAEIISKHGYWKARGQLQKDGSFFMTAADIQAIMGVSARQAKRLTADLRAHKVVMIAKKGVPAKNYWRLDFEVISGLTSRYENVPTGQDEIEPTGEAANVPTITNNTEQKIQTLPAAAYSVICEYFSKGYEAMEGSKLSWVGKGAVYGKAVKTLIAQAMDILPKDGRTTEAVIATVKERAEVLYRTMREEQKTKRPFYTRQKFVPTTLVGAWNAMVPVKSVSFAEPEAVEIPAEELAKHKAATGG